MSTIGIVSAVGGVFAVGIVSAVGGVFAVVGMSAVGGMSNIIPLTLVAWSLSSSYSYCYWCVIKYSLL